MISTLLISKKLESGKVPPPFEIRNDLFRILRKNYNVDDFRTVIKYNGIKIGFSARFIKSIRRYFIYFTPLREKTEEGSKYYEKLRIKTLEFMNDFITKNELKFCDIEFEALSFGNEKIDISEWKFVLFYNGTQEYKVIKDFFRDREEKKMLLNKIFESHMNSNRDVYIIYFEKDPIENTIIDSRIQNLKSFLNKFITNNIFVKQSNENRIQEEITNSRTLKESFLIFVVHPNDKPIYDKLKLFLIENQIPSQFIKLSRMDSNRIWRLKNNLSLEIIKKNQKNCIELKPLSNEVDGFICLSDIPISEKSKLFGISITKISESNYTDKIEIFPEIKYIIEEGPDKISLDEENINKIVDKLDAYSDLKNIIVDLHFTRRIDDQLLNIFIQKLKNIGVKVRKAFYISNMSTRFVFDRTILNSEYECCFSIIDKKVGLLDVSGRVITHGNIFPIYVELLYPQTELTKQDIENIIWIIKKRTYRIDNFPALKLPETIKFFRSAKNTFCLLIHTKLSFPSPFII